MSQDGVTLRVEGLRELQRTLRMMDSTLAREIRPMLNEAIEPTVEMSRRLVPRRSGRLADSIRPLSTQRTARVAAGGARVPYAGPIHWGWPRRNIRPQPFLVDALGMTEGAILARLTDGTSRLIDRVLMETA